MMHAWGCDVDRFEQYGQPTDPRCTCGGVGGEVFTQLERAIHAGIAPNWMTVARAVGSQEHYNEFLHDIAASVQATLVPALREAAFSESAAIADQYAQEALEQRDGSDYPESRIGMQYHGLYHGAQDVAIRIRRRLTARSGTHTVSDELLRRVHERLATTPPGYLGELKTDGDYSEESDATVDGSLRAVIGAVVDVLSDINGTTWTDRLSSYSG